MTRRYVPVTWVVELNFCGPFATHDVVDHVAAPDPRDPCRACLTVTVGIGPLRTKKSSSTRTGLVAAMAGHGEEAGDGGDGGEEGEELAHG